MPSSGRACLRTCIGCRKRDDRAALLRLVGSDAGGLRTVVVDERGRLPGRGAWLHPRPECLAMAMKRKAFQRAFRGAVATGNAESYFRDIEETSTGSCLGKTVHESGSEH